MDFMQISSVVVWIMNYKTIRAPLAFGVFFMSRQIIQNLFLMGRPAGFLWTDPGVPSLTVPYFDTNDFFYSGHVGSCFVYMFEFYAQGSFIWILCLLNMIIQWVILMIFRTHYVIDMILGIIVAHLACILSERATYFLDVKIFGRAGKERSQKYFTPCPTCGWSNIDVLQMSQSPRELHFLENKQNLECVEPLGLRKNSGGEIKVGKTDLF